MTSLLRLIAISAGVSFFAVASQLLVTDAVAARLRAEEALRVPDFAVIAAEAFVAATLVVADALAAVHARNHAPRCR